MKWPKSGLKWPSLTTFSAIESRQWLRFENQIEKAASVLINMQEFNFEMVYHFPKSLSLACLLSLLLLFHTNVNLSGGL